MVRRAFLALLTITMAAHAGFSQSPLSCTLLMPASVQKEPFTGRVFVVVSKKELKDQVFRQSWFTPEPFFAEDVTNWKPDTPHRFAAQVSFPQPLEKLSAGKYWVQAIADRDQGSLNALSGFGNLFSKGQLIEYDPKKPMKVHLVLNNVVPMPTFTETDRRKLFQIDSPLLSKFHGKPMKLQAGVLLPKSYAAKADRKYPVVFEIPGFSGDHRAIESAEKRGASEVDGIEAIWVMLDPNCRLGHHVFADSANNGPVGQALVEEFIPAFEKAYRCQATPRSRLLTGHSSGGWSSLWLQVTYPDFFGGVWSTAPDPVDFRDFQRVNLYERGANLFKDAKGKTRPIARKGDKVVLTYPSFSDMEVVFGRGGQLQSFEAVFSPRGPDGKPLQLWDRRTGAVDPAVAESWQKYDIRKILDDNWPTLGPKLKGKLHVYMGDLDTFYLEGATKLLQQALKKLGSDAVVEIFPGKDHGTLMDAAMRKRIAQEMAKTWK